MKNCTIEPTNNPIKALITIVLALKIIPVITPINEIPIMIARYFRLSLIIEIYLFRIFFYQRIFQLKQFGFYKF